MAVDNYEILLEQPEGSNRQEIILKGELTVENTKSVYNYLLNNAYHTDSLKLFVNSPANIDLCFFQLIIGFMESRNKLNKETTVDIDIDESQLELLTKTGIIEKISSLQKEGL